MRPAFAPAIAYALALVVAQWSLAPFVRWRDTTPSLALIAIVLYTLRTDAAEGAGLALIVGLVEDAIGATPGAWTLATPLIAIAVALLARRVFADSVGARAAMVGLAVIIRDAMYWTFRSLTGYPAGYAQAHFHAALWQGALTALVALAFLAWRERYATTRTIVRSLR